MRNTLLIAVLAAALVLLALPHTARADEVFFSKDAVISRDIPGDVSIGYASEAAYISKKGTSPTLKMTGGKLAGKVFTWNRSTFLVSAGTLAGTVNAQDNSKIILSGGSASGDLEAQANSIVEVRGGSVYRLYAKEHGTVNVRGGRMKEMYVSEQGTLNIYGMGLTKKVAETLSGGGGSVTRHTLSGKLADGTVLDSKILLLVYNSGTKLNLINTPAAH